MELLSTLKDTFRARTDAEKIDLEGQRQIKMGRRVTLKEGLNDFLGLVGYDETLFHLLVATKVLYGRIDHSKRTVYTQGSYDHAWYKFDQETTETKRLTQMAERLSRYKNNFVEHNFPNESAARARTITMAVNMLHIQVNNPGLDSPQSVISVIKDWTQAWQPKIEAHSRPNQ